MAEKKRKHRRSYLNDFKVGASGDYSYMGKVHRYEGERPHKEEMTRAGLLTGAILVSLIVIAFLPASFLTGIGHFYVVPFLIFELIAVCLLVFSAVRLIFGGEELREYVFEKSVKKLPIRADIVSVASGLCAVSSVVDVALNGFGGKTAATLIAIALNAPVIAAAQLLKRSVLAEKWSANLPEQPEPEEAGETDHGEIFPEYSPEEEPAAGAAPGAGQGSDETAEQ